MEQEQININGIEFRGIRLKTAGRSLPTLRKPNKAILTPTKKLPTTPTHFSKFRKNL